MERHPLIDTYCEAWSQQAAERRASLLESVWAPGASYTDPSVQTHGAAELLAHIDKVLARRPGAKVVRTSPVDLHHGVARFAWRLVEAAGKELPEGLDIVFLAADGARIERVIGFFGPLHKP